LKNLLRIRHYSLRDFARLNKKPLCENCLHLSVKQNSRDFRRGGRSFADAKRGQQGESTE